MRFYPVLIGISVFVACAPPALAGQLPLTQPAPGWVDKVPLDPQHLVADPPEVLVLDSQQRIMGDLVWSYIDKAVRITSPDTLAQLATVTLPWAPDKGDLIIHEVSILRDGRTIDLLANGKGFTVLRREEALEAQELTGILTATMQAEGLQVGDVFRLRYSTTLRDAVLAGHADVGSLLPAAPLRIGFGRARIAWAQTTPAHWRTTGTALVSRPFHAGGYTGVEIALPAPKQPERPPDAPPRYLAPPMIEASTFSGWDEVSRVMAPLYATDTAIVPGSPLAAVVTQIKAAPTPLARTEAALRHVQDDVRYLAVTMGSGNYVPQPPADTWAKRYGDCKAKTLLLLALLRGAGIEAEPVLANATLGDMLPDRLPSAAAFDHVLVRAVVDGQVLWLDGTASGTRIQDLGDAPPLRHVLPLRAAGAGLIDVPLHAAARPMVSIDVQGDESTSVDLPSVVTARVVLRGPMAAPFFALTAQMDGRQRSNEIEAFFTQLFGEGQWVDTSIANDLLDGSSTIGGRGLVGTQWHWRDKRMQRNLGMLLKNFKFAPDRSRTDWADIPVALPGPVSTQYHLALQLPDGGRGFVLDGAANATARIAGQVLTRSLVIAGGVLQLDERMDSPGGELPASAVPQARDDLDGAAAALPKLTAPGDVTRAWMVSPGAATRPGQLSKIDAILEIAIHDREATDISPMTTRASLRKGIGDFAGAAADYAQALAIAPSVENHLLHAAVLADLGQQQAALADAQAARAIDPSSLPANVVTAHLLAETGDLPGAVALLDRRIALGGDERDALRLAKAELLGEFGDAQAAIALLDTLIADKPGNPQLLNARCWAKGTRNLMLDTALKDCTQSIELSSSTVAALDSRAMVWFRMGRYAEAMQDLDAVLAQVPNLGETRFMRAIVEFRQGSRTAAAADLAIARKINPDVVRRYARYGITP